MKPLIHYILTGLFCILAFSCNNNFLNDGSDVSTATVGSQLFISPNWEAADYPVTVPTAGNVKFTVVKTPDWLQVNTRSGQFINDVALINCSASVRTDYTAVGIYNASMILDIEGKGNTLVPVAYISEGNPVIQTVTDLSLQYDYYSNTGHTLLTIRNTGDGILLWGMAEKPDWITCFLPGGTALPNHTLYPLPQNNDITLDLYYNTNNPILSGDWSGKIVIASNDKSQAETVITISFDTGNPSLYCYPNPVNFGRTETSQVMEISNRGNGLLTWKIESCPAWLNVSDSSGALSPYSSQYITFTCDRSLLPNGQQSPTIYLKTNDKNNPSYAITITAAGYTANPENIRAIEGTVTDAWADKTTDILYLTTSQPNRLLAYNMKTKTIDKQLALSKAPTCFSVSEDGHQAVVGHGGLITWVNTDNFSVTKTINVDYNLFDIEWGAGNWVCYTPGEEVQWCTLQWKNLDTGETYDTPDDNNMYGKTFIKKIPRQNYIIASRTMLSPSGIIVYDIRNRSLSQYFHQDIADFWFSSDGDYLFSSWNQIYRTSSILASSDNVSLIGRFSPSPYPIYRIDPNTASHSVWILSSPSDYYFDNSPRVIQQYEDNDYTLVNTYYYDDYYNSSPAQAQYIFTNGSGNELVVIKSNNRGDWGVEHVPVTK